MFLALLQDEADRSVPVSDNHWLDAYRLPFGSWIEQTVDWINEELQWLTDAIKWPFEQVFNVLLSSNPDDTSLITMSWVWIAIGFFLIGSFLRNTRIGLMSAVMVVTCGFLGQQFWPEVARTFGMILISVTACALIAIPWGVLCGRVDAVWNATRPVLDAMQVVHSFVWMIPFIFFFRTGDVTATILTMSYALPPLVRLTNLGIRQVPGDVVEASRAFGQNEFRVLTDVQIPLARPAIMTGLNQTLLLAFSMLGIAAYAGAKGLGWLMFRAFNNQDRALGASAGLCFFLCAVLLDRITQPEDDDGLSLWGRISQAFSYRRDPEGTYEAEQSRLAAAASAEEEVTEYPEPVGSFERMALLVTVAASAVAAIATLLPWGRHAGKISAWGRELDEDLVGQSFSGLAGSGGSFFGIIVLGLSLLAIAAAMRPLVTVPARISGLLNRVQGFLLIGLAALMVLLIVLNALGVGIWTLQTVAIAVFVALAALILADTWARGTPRLGNDGALICAVGAFGVSLGYLLANPSPFVAGYSDGIGVWVAVIASAVAALAALQAVLAAPYASRRPLPTTFETATLFKTFAGIAIIAIGAVSAWVVDERAGIENRIYVRGLTTDGPRMGVPVLVFGAIAALVALTIVLSRPAARRRWQMGTLVAAFAAPVIGIAAAFTFTISRNGDTDYFNDRLALTGAGILLAIIGAIVFFSIGRSTINHFHRRRVYLGDSRALPDDAASDGYDEIDLTAAENAGAER